MKTTMGIALLAGALGACNGINLAGKDHCATDGDCNPGRVCEDGVCNPAEMSGPVRDASTPIDLPDAASPGYDASTAYQQDASGPLPDVAHPIDAHGPLSDVAHPIDAALPPACLLQEGPVRAFTSLSQVNQAIAGQWLFCFGEPSNTNHQPIEFTADGHWFALTQDESGNLVRLVGFGKTGSFVISLLGNDPASVDGGFDSPKTAFDITLTSDSTPGTFGSNLSFSDSPRRMLYGPGTYVPAPPPNDATAPVFDAIAPPADGESQACSLPESPVRLLASLAEAYQAINGQWLFCSGEPSNTADQPVEFTSDGHWYQLARDASGQLTRRVGFNDAGTFVIYLQGTQPVDPSQLTDAGFDSPQGIFFIQTTTNAGAVGISNLAFSQSPRRMLYGPSTYVLTPAPIR